MTAAPFRGLIMCPDEPNLAPQVQFSRHVDAGNYAVRNRQTGNRIPERAAIPSAEMWPSFRLRAWPATIRGLHGRHRRSTGDRPCHCRKTCRVSQQCAPSLFSSSSSGFYARRRITPRCCRRIRMIHAASEDLIHAVLQAMLKNTPSDLLEADLARYAARFGQDRRSTSAKWQLSAESMTGQACRWLKQ